MVKRTTVLTGLLGAMALLTAVVLADVLAITVFAITVAYVLYPLRQQLVRRGFPNRIASMLATAVAFATVVVLVAPLLFILYRRRLQLIDILAGIPESIEVSIAGVSYVVDVTPLLGTAEEWIREGAITIAAAAPRLALGLVLFAFVVYGVLYRPGEIRNAVRALVPGEYHDIVVRLHERTRQTLFGIYVLQLTTALATVIIAATVFRILGYEAWLSLAVIAGILQFVPVIGPSILILALAAGAVMAGDVVGAVAVLVVGLLFVSFLPDAVIRPSLAELTGRLSPTLYFVGFVGGILTIGALGVIVGPLAVALLVEVVEIVSGRDESVQAQL